MKKHLLACILLAAVLGASAFAAPSYLRFTWSDNSTTEIGFIVQRADIPAGPYTEIARVAADITSFADFSVVAGASYSYRVAAYNDGGQSAWTNIATGASPALPPPLPPTTPGDPTVITVSVSITPGTSGAIVALNGP